MIKESIKHMCIDANYNIGADIQTAFNKGLETETSPIGKSILVDLLENARIAGEKQVPICQDTGMVVVFAEIGQDVHLVGGDVKMAIDQGIREGYEEGYLRKSVVADPLNRVNTKDNTPGIVYFDIVPGDQVKLKVALKGFGSENMSK
jgi:fumarate hydratase subunit alpha